MIKVIMRAVLFHLIDQRDRFMVSEKIITFRQIGQIRNTLHGLPWWSRVKNPPANAQDTDSIPGLERSHMPECAESLCSAMREATTNEKLTHHS